MKLKVHPIAAAYPESKEAVKDSIAEIGLLHPIVLLDGMIIDGRGRAEACHELGIEPKTVQYRGKKDWKSLVTYVRAVNEHRRHMTISQRSVVAFKLTKLAEPEKDGVFENKNRKFAVSALSQEEAAEALGVSERSVETASKVVQHGAVAVVEAVESGEVSVSDAAAVVELPKSEQTAALKKVRSGKARTLRKAISTNGKPPKPGQQKQDLRLWGAWQDAFGKLKRITDDLNKDFRDDRYKTMTAQLNALYKTFEAWKNSPA